MSILARTWQSFVSLSVRVTLRFLPGGTGKAFEPVPATTVSALIARGNPLEGGIGRRAVAYSRGVQYTVQTTTRHWMRVVALPISRQQWLYAVSGTGQMTAPAAPKQTASGFVGWAQNVIGSASQRAQNALQRQWDGLVQAPDGSIKNRFYRMAMSVLAREDVTESFLKTIPPNATQLQLIAPAAQPVGAASRERYVRRRMRLMLQQQARLHQCRMVSWLGAIVPSAPLAFLPIPNIPMYYAGYRAWSHWQALKGARQALGLFQHAELWQLDHIHEQQSGQNSDEDASRKLSRAVVVCTAPDLDAAARAVSSDHEASNAADMCDIAKKYDLPDLQDFYQRALRQKRHKAA